MRIFWDGKQARTEHLSIEATVNKTPEPLSSDAVIKLSIMWNPDDGKITIEATPSYGADSPVVREEPTEGGRSWTIQPGGWA